MPHQLTSPSNATRRRLLAAGSAAVGAAALPRAARAQAWPAKPVKYVVPFTAAGATDITARIIADKLGPVLGQSFVVENRPGAAGNVGTEYVAKSAPDGYTALQLTAAQAISATLYTKLGYQLETDLEPAGLIALVPNVMVINPDVPAQTVAQFTAWARANPGKVNYASSGAGTTIHMSAELYKMLTGVQMTHIPYKGSAPAIADLVGGQVHVMFDNLPSSLQQIKAGKLRALAICTAKRYPGLPDLPTMIEAGVPGYDSSAWFGMVLPKGTPRDIITRLNTEINKILALPEVREKLEQQGAIPAPMSIDEFRAHIASEIKKWSAVVKASGAKVE